MGITNQIKAGEKRLIPLQNNRRANIEALAVIIQVGFFHSNHIR